MIVVRSAATGVMATAPACAPIAGISAMTCAALDKTTAPSGGTGSTGGATLEACAPTSGTVVMTSGEPASNNVQKTCGQSDEGWPQSSEGAPRDDPPAA